MDRGRPDKALEYAPGGELYQGSAIRQMRKAKDIGLRQLAALIHCDAGGLSRVENNRAIAPKATLEKIAEILGVNARELARKPRHPRLAKQNTGTIEQYTTADGKRALEDLKADVQDIKAEMAEVKAIVNELTSYVREIGRPPFDQQVTEGLRSPFEQNSRESSVVDADAEVRGVELPVDIVQVLERAKERCSNDFEIKRPVEELNEYYIYDSEKAARWHEEITKVEEQEGDLFLVMKGFQGMIVPPELYEEQAKPIPEKGVGDVAVMRHTLACLEQRRAAFERQIRRYKLYHIMPIGALIDYKKLGVPSSLDSSALCVAEWATLDQQAEHIHSIIRLLKTCPNYQLGLLTGEAGENAVYHRFVWEVKWEVKGRHTLLVEDHDGGQRNFIVKDPSVVGEVCRHFNSLWKSEAIIKDKDKVIELLEMPIESLEMAYAIS